MCDHSKSTYAIKTAVDLLPVPTESEKCHIYYVHQDGKILCEPNVQFQPGKNPPKQVTSLTDSDKNKGNLFCGEDRLTLVYVLKSIKRLRASC
jgi:hypothetical protein